MARWSANKLVSIIAKLFLIVIFLSFVFTFLWVSTSAVLQVVLMLIKILCRSAWHNLMGVLLLLLLAHSWAQLVFPEISDDISHVLTVSGGWLRARGDLRGAFLIIVILLLIWLLVFHCLFRAKYVNLRGNLSWAHNFSLQLIDNLFPWLFPLIKSRHLFLLVMHNRISVMMIIVIGGALRLLFLLRRLIQFQAHLSQLALVVDLNDDLADFAIFELESGNGATCRSRACKAATFDNRHDIRLYCIV